MEPGCLQILRVIEMEPWIFLDCFLIQICSPEVVKTLSKFINGLRKFLDSFLFKKQSSKRLIDFFLFSKWSPGVIQISTYYGNGAGEFFRDSSLLQKWTREVRRLLPMLQIESRSFIDSLLILNWSHEFYILFHFFYKWSLVVLQTPSYFRNGALEYYRLLPILQMEPGSIIDPFLIQKWSPRVLRGSDGEASSGRYSAGWRHYHHAGQHCMYMFSYMRHEPRLLTFMKIYAKTWFPYKVARAFSERGKRKFTRSLYLNAHYVNRHESILLKSAFSVFFLLRIWLTTEWSGTSQSQLR